MTTIINPGQNDTGNSATIWVLGIIVILLIGLFAFYVWPGFATPAAANPTSTTNTYNTTDNTQPPVVNNYINATTTINNSTTTRR